MMYTWPGKYLSNLYTHGTMSVIVHEEREEIDPLYERICELSEQQRDIEAVPYMTTADFLACFRRHAEQGRVFTIGKMVEQASSFQQAALQAQDLGVLLQHDNPDVRLRAIRLVANLEKP